MSAPDRNPYAPPQARVGEVPVPRMPPMPFTVILGVNLIGLGGVWGCALRWHDLASGLVGPGAAAGSFAVVGITGVLAVAIMRRRAGPRAALAIVIGASAVAQWVGGGSEPLLGPQTLRMLIPEMLEMAAVVLLFTPPARRWFARPAELT